MSDKDEKQSGINKPTTADNSRRKLLKTGAWATPVILSVSLPAHGQSTELEPTTTPPPTTTPIPPTTTIAPATGCNAMACSTTYDDVNGGGGPFGVVLNFDGTNCSFDTDIGALIGDANAMFAIGHDFRDLTVFGSMTAWTTTLSDGHDFLPNNSGTFTTTFTATNPNLPNVTYEFCLTATLITEGNGGTRYELDVGPL